MNPYSHTDEEVIDTRRRVHANGEQTHVAVLTAGDDYVAVAYDIDPTTVSPVAAECVAYDPTAEGVDERAERWMQAHPKGVAGDAEGGGGSSRWRSALWRMLRKLNEYGNQQVEQIQDQQQEPPKQ